MQLLSINPALPNIAAEAIRQAAEQTADPSAIIEAALAKMASDPGAMYEDAVVASLKVIRQKDEATYARLTAQAKGCKTRLDKLTAPERDNHQDSTQDQVMTIARKDCILGHDTDGRGIAVIETDDHREVWYIDSYGFKEWLRAAFYRAHHTGIPELAMNTAISTLAAIAKHDGCEMLVHVRAAKVGDVYFVDLCDDRWRVIRVASEGWKIVDRSSVYFTRTKNMRPLPTPGKGNLDMLWAHVNIPKSRRLPLLAWLLECYRPETPYPGLEQTGEQGSAKSTNQHRLRDLVDPNKVPLRGRPKTVEDIYVAAANNHIVSFENLSHLTAEQQDALCTLATGGGFATRQFYTNGDEHVLEAKRPVMLNGINAVATQPDLIERVISIEAPTIPPDDRKDEQTLELAWQRDYPAIFAGLLDLFSAALRKLPEVKLAKKYRMADYQLLGEAVAAAQGQSAGTFSAAYGEAVAEGIDRSLETFGIANAVQVFMCRDKPWEGTYLALLNELSSLPGVDRSHWPKSPRNLAGQLKRIAPGLRLRGILIEALGHGRTGSRIRISHLEQ